MFYFKIFRANDIRGRYNQDFNLSFTKDLAYSLLALCKKKTIQNPKFLIGQDARLSSPEISEALIMHLKKLGIEVSFIGLAPSPLCYFLLSHYKLTACIVITASHNPKDFNGFKILFHKKHKLSYPIQELKKLVQLKKTSQKISSYKKNISLNVKKDPSLDLSFDQNLPKNTAPLKIKKEEFYLSSLKKEFSYLKTFAFAIDTGNGALGPLAKKVFPALGLNPHYLFNKPDGNFPNHHPDPTIEINLVSLKNKIKQKKLDFGFAFDGDGDRLVLITKEGKTILGDELGFLFLDSLIKERIKQGQETLILADVKCSDWFFQAVQTKGAKIIMTRSGHGLIRTEMEKQNATLALEFSGHIFFNDRKNRGFDDALYASLRLLEILSSQTQPLSLLLPKTSSAKTGEIRIEMPQKEVLKNLSKIKLYLKNRGELFKKIDGIRLSRNESWALFRSSKTQEALSMRFEAPTKQNLSDLKTEFSKVMALKIH